MSKPKVLLIDDEVSFTNLTKINLEASGKFRVGVVNDPSQALEVARTFEPDVVVLDVAMPGKDGGDILVELKQDPAMKRVPVIVLTALVSLEETSEEGLVNPDGELVLAKPVSAPKLIKTIEARLTCQVRSG